jgi:molybdenum cofactor cytidylyltransferase
VASGAGSPVGTDKLPVVLVLASGRGARFRASGGTTHKLHAPIGPLTVLEHTLAAVRASGLPWHLEEAGHAGMGDSIAAAVSARANAPAWLILPGDLPLITADTLLRVAQAPADAVVVRPRYQGELGHPVRFTAACGAALRALRGDQGAAPVAKSHPALLIDVDDPGCVTDIDTVQDLARAQALWEARRAAASGQADDAAGQSRS